ncbi:MAG TPA: Spy/CpxP family protein refolding chaperone [Pseudolabrys sp.]|nr:Spy/CpxP family protein refolding chaperone [Pseudolabrys sp.]
MRRQTILAMGALAAISLAPGAANAQFELSPRGIIGALTRPLRHLLPHHHHSHHVVRHRGAHETRSASRENESADAQREVVGTPIWPDAYAELVGYVFWPEAYRQKLGRHGFADIATAVAGPLPSRPATVGTASRETEDTDTVGDAARSGGEPNCAGAVGDESGWPAGRIEQMVTLNDAQRGAFAKLRDAYLSGAASIKASCRSLTGLSPTRRLEAMEQRLWAVRDAGVLIREPFKAFYKALSEDQKTKFGLRPQDDSDKAVKREQQECFARESGEVQRFLKEMRETVRPTQAQSESFDALSKKSSQMAKLLMASCAQATPSTPLERLDAADTRLTAINYAATTVDIALNDFYAGLSAEQKKKFDGMGR